MDIDALRSAISEWNKIDNDPDRWRWLAANPDTGLVAMLDNDDTAIAVPWRPGMSEQQESERDALQDSIKSDFREYIGNGPGIDDLLQAFGVPYEHV